MVISETVYGDYLAFLLSGKKAECVTIVQGLIDQKIFVKDLYLELFQRSMYQVGKLWEENKVSVATEHMATAITEGLLQLVYPMLFSADHVGKSAIIACVPQEYHQLGAKMVADIFEMNGWDATMKIRANDSEIPIIAVTAYASDPSRKKSMEAGCNDFITKPINKDKLIRLIEKYLQKERISPMLHD